MNEFGLFAKRLLWFAWSWRSTQTSYACFRPQTGHWHVGTKCSEMMIYLARWNKKTNKQNGRLLSFLLTFDPDTWQTNTVIFSEFNWKIVFSKITSRISKPLSVFDKLGLRSKCRGEQRFSTQSGKKRNVTGGGMLRVGCNSSRISSMSAIEWPGWLKWEETAALPPPPPPRQGTAAVAFAWSGLFVACLRSLKRSRSVRLVSPIYCFFFTSFTLDHIC